MTDDDKVAAAQPVWWLIYGPGRSGTTYVNQLVAPFARRVASDWGLGRLTAGLDAVRHIDRARYLADLAANVLASAKPMTAKKAIRMDLLYKQAGITVQEFAHLVEMFGPPQRRLFCMRAPDSYMASAVKKFPDMPAEKLQQNYIKMFDVYREVGGDILNYGPALDTTQIAAFLAPLPLGDGGAPFEYKGEGRPELVPPEMAAAYESFRAEFCPGSFRLDPQGGGANAD